MRLRDFIGVLLGGIAIGGLFVSMLPVQAGPYLGEQPVYSRDQGWEERLFYVASGNGVGQVEYQGFAQMNTATSAALWRVRRFTYDSSNRVSAVEWAGGNDAFNQILDDRVTLSY